MSTLRSTRSPSIRRATTAAVTAALALSLVSLVDGSPTAAPAAADPAAKATAAKSHRITLVTGDTVTFTDGREPTLHVEQVAREGRGAIAFRSERRGSGFYVIPSDAETYVRSGVLDRELFNVRGLVRQRLTDDREATLPVIVTYGKGTRAGAQDLPATAGKERPLPSVNGAAVEVARANAADFWAALDRPGARTLDRRIAKVWLDQRLEPVLDKSVPQIGAPEAWKSGYDGKGVKVAVLDTGIDAGHPDLEDRIAEAKSFVEGDPDAADVHGHGTHVAATIVGSGAASGGRYKGVAPGAQLNVGKVCAVDSCPESAILEGMDWAAKSGAKVVNISLGGGTTDGTDLFSQRVNELTKKTGTLFVIAAGNDGADLTVGTPGAADAALTVGAVDRNDKLASFSSRGPRWGDAAVKPEISAPGVEINAARAKGMLPDYPGDGEGYARISGTSMATPHVAGAAAILAQAKPELKAEALKNALVSGAKDVGRKWHEQGAGRLDVPAALQPVTAPGSVNVGRFAPDAKQTTREVMYANSGDKPATLKLALSQKGWDGHASKAAWLSATELTVPAKGTASVRLTVDAAKDERGVYGGVLTATAEGTSLRTPVSWYREATPKATHKLTLKILDRDSKPLEDVYPDIYAQVDKADVPANDPFEQPTGRVEAEQTSPGVWTATVPPGKYLMAATAYENTEKTSRGTLLAASNVQVAADKTVTLDARKAKRVSARTPQPTYRYNQGLSLGIGSITGFALTLGTDRSQAHEVWATPAAGPDKGQLAMQESYTLAEHTVRASAQLGGKKVDLQPEYQPLQAAGLPGKREVPVVYVGAGTADDFAKADVKGKAALVKVAGPGPDDRFWSFPVGRNAEKAAERAKKAGAALVLAYADQPGARAVPPVTTGPRAVDLPLLGIRQADGEKLRGQAKPTVKLDIKAAPGFIYNQHYAPPTSAGIPQQLNHTIDPSKMKKARTGYHSEVPGLAANVWNVAFENDRNGTYANPNPYFRAPARIDQYYGGITGKQFWRRQALLTDGQNTYGQLDFKPWRGAQESFFSGPMTMVDPQQDGLESVVRYKTSSGEDVLLATDLLGDSAPGHFGGTDAGDSIPFTYMLSRDGKEIPAKQYPGSNTPYFEMPKEDGEYRMEGTFVLPKDSPYAPNEKVKKHSPRVDNVWTFRSKAPNGNQCTKEWEIAHCSVPAWLQLRYAMGLDLNNQAKAGGKHRIGITAAPPERSTDGGTVRKLSLSYSLDSGKTWRKAKVTGTNGRFTARLDHRAPKGTEVWLKTEARSTSGATVTQTVHKAYTLR